MGGERCDVNQSRLVSRPLTMDSARLCNCFGWDLSGTNIRTSMIHQVDVTREDGGWGSWRFGR